MGLYKGPIYTLGAGEGLDLVGQGNYVRFFSSTGATDLNIGIDGSTPEPLPVGIGVSFPQKFERVRVENPNAGSVTFQIAIAVGHIADDRLNVSGSINAVITSLPVPTGLQSTADKSLAGTATTQIIAANSARTAVTITNLDGNASIIRVGDSNAGASRGVQLAPGQSMTLETEDAVHAYNPGSAQSVGIVEVLA